MAQIISGDTFDLDYMHFSEKEYEELLMQKVESVMTLFQSEPPFHLCINEDGRRTDRVTILSSPNIHCRERLRFAIRSRSLLMSNSTIDETRYFSTADTSSGETVPRDFVYAMWEHGYPTVIVEDFRIASRAIYSLMPVLRDGINNSIIISQSLVAIHFLTSTIGEVVITLIYTTAITEDTWRPAAEELQYNLTEQNIKNVTKISLIGRSSGVKVVVGVNFVIEHLHLSDGRSLLYKQVDDGFSNPNAIVNTHGLDWMCSVINEEIPIQHRGDLLEMFCGNGNHSVALAQYFPKLLAVEINPNLCVAARENFAMNNVLNAHVVKCDSAHFAMRILKKREYLLQQGINRRQGEGAEQELIHFQFQTVLVDPPRAGLDKFTLQAIKSYPYIIYISCCAENLRENLRELAGTHHVQRMAVLDHFAYTPHIEVAVFLVQINNTDVR